MRQTGDQYTDYKNQGLAGEQIRLNLLRRVLLQKLLELPKEVRPRRNPPEFNNCVQDSLPLAPDVRYKCSQHLPKLIV